MASHVSTGMGSTCPKAFWGCACKCVWSAESVHANVLLLAQNLQHAYATTSRRGCIKSCTMHGGSDLLCFRESKRSHGGVPIAGWSGDVRPYSWCHSLSSNGWTIVLYDRATLQHANSMMSCCGKMIMPWLHAYRMRYSPRTDTCGLAAAGLGVLASCLASCVVNGYGHSKYTFRYSYHLQLYRHTACISVACFAYQCNCCQVTEFTYWRIACPDMSRSVEKGVPLKTLQRVPLLPAGTSVMGADSSQSLLARPASWAC